ncbi:CaiB/BaiF CoA transferase family protein [Aeromicrobium piscarium]|uniref:CoA transferase n=1 Tax=Aeromicrobium piscarium TaxID=2590901 RepID=A0A554S7H8_9ACTN|nr:CoA transferase [Aeromicrobium piscarium]TSD62304.1 CoA transferase [Aeromicrobium piscarium]
MNQITPETASAPAPLTGITVLELGAFMAAPFGAMQLADLGADVIKIEPPVTGEPVRSTGDRIEGHSAAFMMLNRNKRSVAVDLKSEDGKRVLRELIEHADVLIENFRPGALTRLGFGYDEVRRWNPALVYVSGSGWGQDGPLAAKPGLDIMAQARGGLMSVTGTNDGEIVKIGVPVCDLVCGLYIALATMAALKARDVTGEGQFVDTCLYEAGVSLTIWEAARFFTSGEAGTPSGTAHQASAPYQAFRTADGWVTLGAVTPKTWKGACDVFGLERLVDDPRFADAATRYVHREELATIIEDLTRGRTTDDLVDALDDAGVPCAPILRTDQVYREEHLNQRGFFWDAAHPQIGAVRQIGSPMRLSSTPTVRRNAGPVLGADTRDVLAAAGFTTDDIDRMVAEGVVGASTDF